MKVLSPEICRTFELSLCVCLSVHVCGVCGRGRLILNLPSVVGGLRSHLDSVSLCLLFSLLRLSLPPHLCCHFFHPFHLSFSSLYNSTKIKVWVFGGYTLTLPVV